MNGRSYIIHGGHEGADRLKVLANATWPATESFLREAGLRPDSCCLDVGCGNGEILTRMLPLIGLSGEILGVDFDQRIIEIARESAVASGPRVSFRVLDVANEELSGGPYDFVFARFLLSHLKKPEAVIQKIGRVLKPGGIFAVEDVDFRGHFSYPESSAFDRYVELYTRVGIHNGADPLIGPRLPGMLEKAGFNDVRLKVVLPTFRSGEGKLMAVLTLEAIQDSLVTNGLTDLNEVQRLLSELRLFTQDDRSIMSLPRIFQVWGIVAS